MESGPERTGLGLRARLFFTTMMLERAAADPVGPAAVAQIQWMNDCRSILKAPALEARAEAFRIAMLHARTILDSAKDVCLSAYGTEERACTGAFPPAACQRFRTAFQRIQQAERFVTAILDGLAEEARRDSGSSPFPPPHALDMLSALLELSSFYRETVPLLFTRSLDLWRFAVASAESFDVRLMDQGSASKRRRDAALVELDEITTGWQQSPVKWEDMAVDEPLAMTLTPANRGHFPQAVRDVARQLPDGTRLHLGVHYQKSAVPPTVAMLHRTDGPAVEPPLGSDTPPQCYVRGVPARDG
jgi:hypothetical protein